MALTNRRAKAVDKLLYDPDVRLGIFAGGLGSLLFVLTMMILLDHLSGTITGVRRYRRERQRAERLAAEPTIQRDNEKHWRKYL